MRQREGEIWVREGRSKIRYGGTGQERDTMVRRMNENMQVGRNF